MDNWQPSTLSWSFSKKTHFDSCRRHYFYHRFWGQDPRLRWTLFEMRNITTLTMLRGQVVHTAIARALNAVRLGESVSSETIKGIVTHVIRERYQESYKRLWHIDNRPRDRKASGITNLLEHYYKFPNIAQRARDAQQVAWTCVRNLVDSEFWKEVVNSDPGNWKQIDDEGYPSFDIDGIQVYATIDFAHCNGSPTIIDWKTGARADQDRRQLTLYSLYTQSKWGWEWPATKLTAVYLQPELRVDTFTPTHDDIEAARDEVKRSFGEMREVEPAFGPAKIEDFPMTEDLRDCTWCRFQGICDGAKRLGAGIARN